MSGLMGEAGSIVILWSAVTRICPPASFPKPAAIIPIHAGQEACSSYQSACLDETRSRRHRGGVRNIETTRKIIAELKAWANTLPSNARYSPWNALDDLNSLLIRSWTEVDEALTCIRTRRCITCAAGKAGTEESGI